MYDICSCNIVSNAREPAIFGDFFSVFKRGKSWNPWSTLLTLQSDASSSSRWPSWRPLINLAFVNCPHPHRRGTGISPARQISKRISEILASEYCPECSVGWVLTQQGCHSSTILSSWPSGNEREREKMSACCISS